MASRRTFLRYLAGSPVLAAWGSRFAGLENISWLDLDREIQSLGSLQQNPAPITTPDQALNVMDFENAARGALPPAHFGYLASGVDDDVTLRANREGYSRWVIRARRMVNVKSVDTSVTLLGSRWDTPIVVCPAGSQKAFHPEGELATARAAQARGHLQILSGVASTSVEDVNAARGMPVWYQLYPTDDPGVAMAVAKRAQAAGCPVLVLTVDLNGGRNLEHQLRSASADSRDCSRCHPPTFQGRMQRRPMFEGLDLSKVTTVADASMNWDYVARVRDAVPRMKVVLKGIVTREDAALAVKHGIDAIVVSNHGGRSEESGRASMDSLPEVVQGVNGAFPVLLDGGIRRGTDIFKALALGARAVGIGRPYLWGLAAFGQPGVEMVLTILRRELELAMRQAGTPSIARITRASVVRA